MNVIKRSLGFVYFIYFMLVFSITMLPAYLAVLFIYSWSEPKRAKALHRIFKVWMGSFMPLVFCPVRRKGAEYFKEGQQYVVVCNHNSYMDIPVSSPWIPGANKTLAKIEFAKAPFFGLIYKTGSILVDRTDEKSRKESFGAMRETLKMGLHLCLYPEGTRNKTDQSLQPFQDGAFVIAIREQQPIMPALIFNTAAIMPRNRQFWAWPKPIRIEFLPPIETNGMKLRELPELKEQVWTIMNDYYVANKDAGLG